MSTSGLTYEGTGSPDPETLRRLPDRLARMLSRMNGFVAFRGGFHLRGSCASPRWHSLEEAWQGSLSLSRLFPSVEPTDIPFAQDCMGDQWLLRDGVVWKLAAEHGGIASLQVDLDEFVARGQADAREWLGLHPLWAYLSEGGTLEPGYVLQATPPFCMAGGMRPTLRPLPIEEALPYLADLARQLANVPDGERVELRVDKPPE